MRPADIHGSTALFAYIVLQTVFLARVCGSVVTGLARGRVKDPQRITAGRVIGDSCLATQRLQECVARYVERYRALA